MRTDWPLKNGLCTITMRTKMARNSGRSDIAWGRMWPSVGRSDPQWGRMLSTWDVKYSFNNIYAISSSSHSLVIWVLHTLRRVHSHIANIPGYFKNISGVTLIPKEPKTAFAPLLGSPPHSPLPECVALSAFSKLIRHRPSEMPPITLQFHRLG